MQQMQMKNRSFHISVMLRKINYVLINRMLRFQFTNQECKQFHITEHFLQIHKRNKLHETNKGRSLSASRFFTVLSAQTEKHTLKFNQSWSQNCSLMHDTDHIIWIHDSLHCPYFSVHSVKSSQEIFLPRKMFSAETEPKSSESETSSTVSQSLPLPRTSPGSRRFCLHPAASTSSSRYLFSAPTFRGRKKKK